MSLFPKAPQVKTSPWLHLAVRYERPGLLLLANIPASPLVGRLRGVVVGVPHCYTVTLSRCWVRNLAAGLLLNSRLQRRVFLRKGPSAPFFLKQTPRWVQVFLLGSRTVAVVFARCWFRSLAAVFLLNGSQRSRRSQRSSPRTK